MNPDCWIIACISLVRARAQNVSGINTYAILAAPKTDGAEALVIGASWLSRATDEAGERRINVRGVALLLAIANYFKSKRSSPLSAW